MMPAPNEAANTKEVLRSAVENAVRKAAGMPAATGSAEPHPSEGQLVIVRPAVVDTIGHVIGNLFQRMYHLINEAREAGTAAAVPLETCTRQLEEFLQLAFDYFAPVSLALQDIPAAEIAQGLARQISDRIGCAVKVDGKLPAGGSVLVDPGRLARTFALLAAQMESPAGRAAPVTVSVTTNATGRSLFLRWRVAPGGEGGRSSQAEIRWAVAEKLLEVQGGALQRSAADTGESQWEIMLPLQCSPNR